MQLRGKDFEAYGIWDGMELEKAKQQFFQYGFSYDSDGFISSIRINLYTPRQHQKMIKVYKELEGT